MKVLGIETSGDHSSVAVVEQGRLIAERVFPSRMSLCQMLADNVQQVLREASLSTALSAEEKRTTVIPDAIAVSRGPGSFTGLRVGVATAKALAHATGLPLVGIPTHEALAWPLAFGNRTLTCVIQHAHKDHVYASLYQSDGAGGLQETAPCRVWALGDLLLELRGVSGRVTIVGDAVQRHGHLLAKALGGSAVVVPPILHLPRASVVAALAEGRVAEADPQAALAMRPIYALASQAERAIGQDLGLS